MATGAGPVGGDGTKAVLETKQILSEVSRTAPVHRLHMIRACIGARNGQSARSRTEPQPKRYKSIKEVSDIYRSPVQIKHRLRLLFGAFAVPKSPARARTNGVALFSERYPRFSRLLFGAFAVPRSPARARTNGVATMI